MKLIIKWARIEVENAGHANELMRKFEEMLNEESTYFDWDWELEEEGRKNERDEV